MKNILLFTLLILFSCSSSSSIKLQRNSSSYRFFVSPFESVQGGRMLFGEYQIYFTQNLGSQIERHAMKNEKWDRVELFAVGESSRYRIKSIHFPSNTEAEYTDDWQATLDYDQLDSIGSQLGK